MDIIYTDKTGSDIGLLEQANFDCAFGSGENNFELTLDASSGITLEKGARVYIENTEYGGIVDQYAYDSSAATFKYSGRSIHGLLASKILLPDYGKNYYSVTGEANEALRAIMEKIGLNRLINCRSLASSIRVTYQFDRFVDAYTGIVAMLKPQSTRPEFKWVSGNEITLEAVKIKAHEALDTDKVDHNFKHLFRPVNHLVCLGKGELKDRVVVNLYADEKGRISRNQTFYGIDEVVEKYDYSQAETDELIKEGTKKLKELQNASSIDITLKSDVDYAIADIVSSYDTATGTEITAQITKKIVSIVGDDISIEYSVGGAVQDSSRSGHGGASSAGGITYAAGKGISISGGTISAEVTRQELRATEKAAEQAQARAESAYQKAAAALARAEEAYKKASEGSTPTPTPPKPPAPDTQTYQGDGFVAKRTGKQVSLTINHNGWAISRSITLGTLPQGMRPYVTQEFVAKEARSTVSCQIFSNGEITISGIRMNRQDMSIGGRKVFITGDFSYSV